MDKNRFETQKEVVNLDPTVHNIPAFFTVNDLKWLMSEVERLENNWTVTEKQYSEAYEKIAQLEKENDKLKGFVEYLQARNKDMVNINGWHMKTNKHLRERIAKLED